MNSLRITVLPNQTFRGVLHFREQDYDASTSLAFHAVETGLAKWSDKGEVSRLADRFAEVLREWLTPAEFAEMKRLNETGPEYAKQCCASQDFCDANMAMHQAFVDVLGREPNVIGEGADVEAECALWDAVWELARARHIGHQ